MDVVDVSSRKIVANSGITAPVWGVQDRNSISADGNFIVIYDAEEQFIKILDVALNLLSADHRNHNHIASITPSPTGPQLLFTLSNNSLRLAVDTSTIMIHTGWS